MTLRTRRRVETGFRSLRDLLICCLGGWGFWFLLTRVEHPEPWLIGACILMMIAPTSTSLYRIINAIYGTSGRLLRQLEGDEEEHP